MKYQSIIILVLLCFLATDVHAELKPEEVAIIAVRSSKESQKLAKYYANVRKIPQENICVVDIPKGEVLSREKWTWAVRPDIQKWIREKDPDKKLRCLVTTWDVPLKIGKANAVKTLQSYKEFLSGERALRLKTLSQFVTTLDSLANGEEVSGGSEASNSLPSSDDTAKKKTEIELLRAQLETSLKAAQARLAKLPESEERQKGLIRIQQLATSAAGLNVLLSSLDQRLKNDINAPSTVKANFESLRSRAIALNETRARLEMMAPGIERAALMVWLLERTGGLLASIEWINKEIETVEKNETGASFDSELSLVMWADDYQLLRWQPNYLNARYANTQFPKSFRTFMVARLDAPSLVLVKGMIDTAIEVEEKGLRGKIYIDARGLSKPNQKNVAPGSYADYDRALLVTAKGLTNLNEQKRLDMPVTLDDKPGLFQAGDCPDAALYCGWYSLAKYVDAFDWKPGAVAYHLASAEATTLHNPKSEVWCKKMLEDGVCATIGPVYEPYLMSFPRPNEFFPLLLKGDLTLVECYYQTKPYNSWAMTLIGDPLYRPFKKNPVKPANK